MRLSIVGTTAICNDKIYAMRSNLRFKLCEVPLYALRVRRIRAVTVQIPLDETDHAILLALRENGRRAYRDIAREVGVSEGTVRSRVRKLEDLGALRFLAFIDPMRLGNSVLALMLVRVEGAAQNSIVEALTSWSETTYVSSLAGRADIYAQLICVDSDALGDVITRTRALLGVIETETMLELGVHKFTYSHDPSLP